MLKKIFFILIFYCFIISLYADTKDKNIKIIEEYYSLLKSPGEPLAYPTAKMLRDAYQLSPKKVDFKTFTEWYEEVGDNKILNISKIADNTYQVKVVMRWETYSLFDVIMTVKDGKIVESKSKELKSDNEKVYSWKDYDVYLFTDYKNKKRDLSVIESKTKNKKVLCATDDTSPYYQLLFSGKYLAYKFYGNKLEKAVYNIPENKKTNPVYYSFYLSPDKNYLFSFGSEENGGLTLEINHDKLVQKSIVKNINIANPKIVNEKGTEYLIYQYGGEPGYMYYENLKTNKIKISDILK